MVEGDWKELIGRTVNEDGNVLDKYGNVEGRCKQLGDAEEEADEAAEAEVDVQDESETNVSRMLIVKNFLSGLYAMVGAEGRVYDRLDNLVGHVKDGVLKRLIGKGVDEDGDILDNNGNMLGQCVLYEEAVAEQAGTEEQACEITLYDSNASETWSTRRRGSNPQHSNPGQNPHNSPRIAPSQSQGLGRGQGPKTDHKATISKDHAQQDGRTLESRSLGGSRDVVDELLLEWTTLSMAEIGIS